MCTYRPICLPRVNNKEMDLLTERRFIVGGRSFRDLVKRRSCEQCDGKIVASSVQEGESIAGKKLTNKCVARNYLCKFYLILLLSHCSTGRAKLLTF